MLLVFFILTANSVEAITLTLFPDEEGSAVDDRELDAWEIVEKTMIEARNERPEANVIVAADRRASIEKLLQALAFLQREGIDAAQILMQPGGSKGGRCGKVGIGKLVLVKYSPETKPPCEVRLAYSDPRVS